MKSLVAVSGIACTALGVSAQAETVVILSEDWDRAGMINNDINNATNAPLTGWAGISWNTDNPTMLDSPVGGNVIRDQTGFGGVYGTAQNAGMAARVRSSNGAMLNKEGLQLLTMGATSVILSFDLKQVTGNLVHVVEFSNNIGFLTSGKTDGKDNKVLLLDTIDGNTDLGLWIAKSYTLQDGVDIGFTDQSYFRIRKLRPSPLGTVAGVNSTYHTYDNLLIAADFTTPAPVIFQLTIAPNTSPDLYDFSWDSQPGKAYDLLSSSDLATPVLEWPVYDPDGEGGNDPYVDIPATGATTTLMAVPPSGPVRFFAMIEKDGPPLFFADFEEDNGGFTLVGNPNDWAWGTPDSDNKYGLVLSTGNGGSANCWATNLGIGGSAPSGGIEPSAVSILRSPVINLTGITGAKLSFAAAYDLNTSDVIEILIKESGTGVQLGAPISPVPGTFPKASDWTTLGPFTLPQEADGKSIYLEFRYVGTDASYIGLYIDDVTVTL